ncbi:MAG: tRNA (N6-isopentenyl adenosine(37)-C2)-methylthiotransferase MiaB [Peptococcaceae bacterium]|nr:tRNA (N6-isopentenyl adenosine(37)-C2)-methylthiotransferase MiaB [Peptococcaceae bacterium]
MYKKFFIQTFGCQMNEHDSEVMAGLLEERFYIPTKDIKEADFILLNTCCIREKAESKVLSMLGSLKKLKAKKPSLIVGVCGCMIQQKNIVPKILHACPFVNLMFGTNNMAQLPDYLERIEKYGQPVYEIVDEDSSADLKLPASREFPFKAFVNIMYGCNNFCTYCIVPYVRGRERSRKKEDIIAEVKELVADGAIEVMLLGQNVDSYGNDFKDSVSFADLLKEIDDIPGIERIRFMTSHPKDFSLELIDVIKNSKHICHSLHLPVQSGSNEVLKRMNRKYTRERYLKIVHAMREAIPDVALTTDIIVGFPGETEEQFQETVDLVETVGFDNAFSFIYSKRPGTAAEKFEDQIPLEIKKERLQRLNTSLSKWSLYHNKKYEGQNVKVLVEGLSENNDNMLSGRTDTGKTVIFQGDPSLIGKIVNVDITTAQTWVLKGKLEEEN